MFNEYTKVPTKLLNDLISISNSLICDLGDFNHEILDRNTSENIGKFDYLKSMIETLEPETVSKIDTLENAE